jgi:predicted HTH transcriptional regulator
VKDNGHITGISSDEEYHMIEAAAQMYCQPVVTFSCKKWNIQGKYILEVDIPCSVSKPVLAQTQEKQWQSYIRVHDQNILAPAVLLSVWKKQHRNKGIYFRYGPEKKILLDYLAQRRCISLSHYCRIGKLTRRKAVDILSDLVILKVIRIEYTDKGAVYCFIEVSGEV